MGTLLDVLLPDNPHLISCETLIMIRFRLRIIVLFMEKEMLNDENSDGVTNLSLATMFVLKKSKSWS